MTPIALATLVLLAADSPDRNAAFLDVDHLFYQARGARGVDGVVDVMLEVAKRLAS